MEAFTVRPYYSEKGIEIYCGDCREILPGLEPVDLLFTSPPYGYQRDYTAKIDDWNALVPSIMGKVRAATDAQVFVNLGLIYREGSIVPYWNALLESARFYCWKIFGWYVWDKGFGAPGDWQVDWPLRMSLSSTLTVNRSSQTKQSDAYNLG